MATRIFVHTVSNIIHHPLRCCRDIGNGSIALCIIDDNLRKKVEIFLTHFLALFRNGNEMGQSAEEGSRYVGWYGKMVNCRHYYILEACGMNVLYTLDCFTCEAFEF